MISREISKMFDIRYKGLRIEVTLSASAELLKENLDLNDVVEILEEGYDCERSKRKENIIERCIKKGNKVVKVVVAKIWVRYPDNFQEYIWRLIHVGKFTYNPKKHRPKGE